jgi:hypothetical protein
MLVDEHDMFFNHGEEFKLLEAHSEVIHCGKSERELVNSISNIQKLISLGSATVSKSEH